MPSMCSSFNWRKDTLNFLRIAALKKTGCGLDGAKAAAIFSFSLLAFNLQGAERTLSFGTRAKLVAIKFLLQNQTAPIVSWLSDYIWNEQKIVYIFLKYLIWVHATVSVCVYVGLLCLAVGTLNRMLFVGLWPAL